MINALKIKSIYILLYIAFALWRVFYNIHLEDIGLSGTEIGSLNALIQASIFIVVIIWGRYADKKGIRPTLRVAMIATSILMYLLGYINEFWFLVVYLPILTFFYHPLGALADALAMQYASNHNKYSYGGFRLWGSLGWAIASIAGGYLFTSIPLKYIFPASALFFLATIPLLSTRKKVHTYKAGFKTIQLKDIINNKALLLFLTIICLYGIVCSPIFYYLNLYFTQLNAPNSIVGLAYAIMAISEIPLFLVGNKLLKRTNAKTLLFLAISSLIFRYILYGYTPGITTALLVGSLQGVSFSFFLVAAVHFIEKLMPKGQHATAQSLIWGTYTGIGQTLGNLIIGFLIDGVGMVGVMKISAFASFLCLIFIFIYFKRPEK